MWIDWQPSDLLVVIRHFARDYLSDCLLVKFTRDWPVEPRFSSIAAARIVHLLPRANILHIVQALSIMLARRLCISGRIDQIFVR
jgi:hypothetical protein